MLENEGYEVVSADSGQKAVALIEKNVFDLSHHGYQDASVKWH